MIETEGDRAEWTFPAEASAVRSVRGLVRGTLGAWEMDDCADVTVLLVSELVTNSVRHASGPIGVRLIRPARRLDGLRVEVSDPHPEPPRERAARPDDEGGRGLQLLACSVREWGTRRGEAGKTVWFELAPAGEERG
ncbi:ATP-binding protein [Streptomyces sp. NPDC060194]|uniref:ATP-binding protein n=1 Tax=Streptomyces sp. NPDC060194 TaxID=3347069 RepID=UPI0036600E34